LLDPLGDLGDGLEVDLEEILIPGFRGTPAVTMQTSASLMIE
jgi:hypothetical protein